MPFVESLSFISFTFCIMSIVGYATHYVFPYATMSCLILSAFTGFGIICFLLGNISLAFKQAKAATDAIGCQDALTRIIVLSFFVVLLAPAFAIASAFAGIMASCKAKFEMFMTELGIFSGQVAANPGPRQELFIIDYGVQLELVLGDTESQPDFRGFLGLFATLISHVFVHLNFDAVYVFITDCIHLLFQSMMADQARVGRLIGGTSMLPSRCRKTGQTLLDNPIRSFIQEARIFHFLRSSLDLYVIWFTSFRRHLPSMTRQLSGASRRLARLASPLGSPGGSVDRCLTLYAPIVALKSLAILYQDQSYDFAYFVAFLLWIQCLRVVSHVRRSVRDNSEHCATSFLPKMTLIPQGDFITSFASLFVNQRDVGLCMRTVLRGLCRSDSGISLGYENKKGLGYGLRFLSLKEMVLPWSSSGDVKPKRHVLVQAKGKHLKEEISDLLATANSRNAHVIVQTLILLANYRDAPKLLDMGSSLDVGKDVLSRVIRHKRNEAVIKTLKLVPDGWHPIRFGDLKRYGPLCCSHPASSTQDMGFEAELDLSTVSFGLVRRGEI